MNKKLKLFAIVIAGILSFSILFLINYNLHYNLKSPLKLTVNGISLIVDYKNGTIKTHYNFSLDNGKTTAFDALQKWCDIDYVDYGWGIIVVEIDNIRGDWIYMVNDYTPNVGSPAWPLNNGDEVKWQRN
ncbi:MAG: DUF4430 domain-containing protein [Candidatus Hodarchaeota archaeon]